MSMITATRWVPRGYAAEFPSRHEFNQDEYDRIAHIAQLNLNDAQEDLADAQREETSAREPVKSERPSKKATAKADEDDLAEYDLDNYDAEPNPSQDDEAAAEIANPALFSTAQSLAFHASNDDDPYITLAGGETGDSDDEDREDLQILPSDSLLLAARSEDELAHLEVFVFEDATDNLYVHHDIMLPAVPLCVEWLDFAVGKDAAPDGRASFAAVGTMDPDIELWDLDTLDAMFPNAILGAGAAAPTQKKRKSKKPRNEYHVDAVLALAANKAHRNLLASASADTTVKLWDLTTQKCARSYAHHTDKACSLAWHPSEATAMLSGSDDRTAAAADMRAPESDVRKWSVDADVETVRWDPHADHFFYVSTESGMLFCFDARTSGAGAAPVWRLQAHEKATTAVAVAPHVPGLLATGGDDRTVKLWDARRGEGDRAGGPKLVASKDLDVGRVFGVDFAPDAEVGLRLAVAGSKGALRVWDTQTNKALHHAFGAKALGAGGDPVTLRDLTEKDRVISGGDGGVGSDEDSDSDSEEADDAGEDEDGGEDMDED